jgi:hypothetical protein
MPTSTSDPPARTSGPPESPCVASVTNKVYQQKLGYLFFHFLFYFIFFLLVNTIHYWHNVKGLGVRDSDSELSASVRSPHLSINDGEGFYFEV